jgi:hypothetical protein
MFKVNVENLSAEVISAEKAGIKSPKDLEKALSIPQMKLLNIKYVGTEIAKGTTKAVASVVLFKAIAANLGYTPEEIEAGVAYIYPATVAAEKPVKVARVKKERGEKLPSTRNMVLCVGNFPVAAEGQKLSWNEHAQVFAEAILALIADGKTTSTRDEVFAKCETFTKTIKNEAGEEVVVKNGIYEHKKSTQEPNAIFSWWRKELVANGFIGAPVAKVAAPAEPAAPQV